MTNLLDEQAIEIVNVPKGKILFQQGDAGDAAYIVNSGAVGIYREIEGRKIPLATVCRGELFGEMAVIDGSPRMATALVLEDSTLTVISAIVIAEKMGQAEPFIKALIQMLMSNLRSVHESYSPKPRTLLDAVNGLAKQSDSVGNFIQSKLYSAYSSELELEINSLRSVIEKLRGVAMSERKKDRRVNAIPAEADI